MAELHIPETLKTTFTERCIAVVNRGLGKLSLDNEVFFDIQVGGPKFIASYSRGELVVDGDKRRSILWKDLSLGDDNTFLLSSEAQDLDDHVRPTVASEEVMSRYMMDDLRSLFVSELGSSILLQHLNDLREAEKLGVSAVTSDDVQEAVNVMDGLIAAHDTKQ